MRRLGCLFCIVVGLATARIARADLITLSISMTHDSGSVGGQSFGDNTVTYAATLTTAQYDACRQDPTCFTRPLPHQTGSVRYGYYHIASAEYLSSLTVGVSGLGTFAVLDPARLDVSDYFGMGPLFEVVSPGGFGALGADQSGPDGLYALDQPQQTGASQVIGCSLGCSVRTSDGVLSFQSAQIPHLTTYGEVSVTVTPEGSTVTPEPGTWVMVGTGLVGSRAGRECALRCDEAANGAPNRRA